MKSPYFQGILCSRLETNHHTNLSSSLLTIKLAHYRPASKGQKINGTRDMSFAMELHSFLGKVGRTKNGTWSSSEGKSQGRAWETNLWLIFFTDKRPLLCGGYSTPDDQRCIQYDAPRDAWYFNTSSLMGRWVNKMHYLLLWQNLLINKNLSKSPFE